MLFPHPSVCVTSGFMLFTRYLPRLSNELANMTATLGSFYWLGFETSGLSPDKKRLAWLGAQQCLLVGSRSVISVDITVEENSKFCVIGRILLRRVRISGFFQRRDSRGASLSDVIENRRAYESRNTEKSLDSGTLPAHHFAPALHSPKKICHSVSAAM